MIHTGFTEEQAVYGADNCQADWNEEALNAAKGYRRVLDLDYQGVKQQLEFNDYTAEQVQYALTNIGW